MVGYHSLTRVTLGYIAERWTLVERYAYEVISTLSKNIEIEVRRMDCCRDPGFGATR